eukprot:scaffold244570_cov37-Tisochrysis_lutea.AAC.2
MFCAGIRIAQHPRCRSTGVWIRSSHAFSDGGCSSESFCWAADTRAEAAILSHGSAPARRTMTRCAKPSGPQPLPSATHRISPLVDFRLIRASVAARPRTSPECRLRPVCSGSYSRFRPSSPSQLLSLSRHSTLGDSLRPRVSESRSCPMRRAAAQRLRLRLRLPRRTRLQSRMRRTPRWRQQRRLGVWAVRRSQA